MPRKPDQTTRTPRLRPALLAGLAALLAVAPMATSAGPANAALTVQQQVVQLVNAQRARVGCRALIVDARLKR